MSVYRSALIVGLLLACPCAIAQSRKLTVKGAMTAEEFKASGLEKLSESEMRALNEWFDKYFDQPVTRRGMRTPGLNEPMPQGREIKIEDILNGTIIAGAQKS